MIENFIRVSDTCEWVEICCDDVMLTCAVCCLVIAFDVVCFGAVLNRCATPAHARFTLSHFVRQTRQVSSRPRWRHVRQGSSSTVRVLKGVTSDVAGDVIRSGAAGRMFSSVFVERHLQEFTKKPISSSSTPEQLSRRHYELDCREGQIFCLSAFWSEPIRWGHR